VTGRGTATGSAARCRLIGAAATAIVSVCAALLVVAPAAAATGAGGYGSLPKWLPKATVQVGRVVSASPAHPWLAIEGDTVRADLPTGRTLVTAVGPSVPEEGAFPVPANSPCSFTITFTRASGSVPLAAGAFTITDELGHVHHPKVALEGDGGLPRRVSPGQPVTLTVSDVLPTGNGTLHWAPTGHDALVSWDFDVEID
jgi:hypothetical protein